MNNRYEEALKKIKELYNQGKLDETVIFTIGFLNKNYTDLTTNNGIKFLNNIEATTSEWIKQKSTFQVFLIRGLSYSYKQEYDSAIKDYSKVIELNPQYDEAYYNRGIAYSDKQEYDSAIKDYSKAI